MPSTLPTITGEHAPKTERKLFSLLELHPQMVMDGELLGKVFEADPRHPRGQHPRAVPALYGAIPAAGAARRAGDQAVSVLPAMHALF